MTRPGIHKPLWRELTETVAIVALVLTYRLGQELSGQLRRWGIVRYPPCPRHCGTRPPDLNGHLYHCPITSPYPLRNQT